MKRFLIEREIPGASNLTQEQLAEISQTSNAAVATLGVPYNWITSYVAGDKVYCMPCMSRMVVVETGDGGLEAEVIF